MNPHRPNGAAPDHEHRTLVQSDPPPPTKEISVEGTKPNVALPALPGGVPGHPYFSAPQGPDEIGRFGEYRVLQKLGEGGMGFVFRAEDTMLRREVALKIMRPEIAQKPLAAERFLREGRAAAGLKSIHILTIYAVGQTHGVPYLASEFLEGMTLDDWIKRQNRAIPLSQVLRVVRDTLRGLSCAHDKGLIHRDIKPANLWLEKGSSRIKLLDFGLTRSEESDMRLTADGAVVGTPAFMSPEQAAGKPVDPRSDLFSVGTVMYCMLAGTNPFARGEVLDTLRAVCFDVLPPISTARTDVKPAISDFLARLLAKEPAGRPANALEALRELIEIEKKIQGEVKPVAYTAVMPSLPVNPPPPPPPPPVASAVAESPKPWQELTNIEGLVVRPKIPAAIKQSLRSTTPNEAPAPKSRTPLIVGIAMIVLAAVVVGLIFALKGK